MTPKTVTDGKTYKKYSKTTCLSGTECMRRYLCHVYCGCLIKCVKKWRTASDHSPQTGFKTD